MSDLINKYPQISAEKALGVSVRDETVRERLMRRKQVSEAVLAEINAALVALDSSPQFEAVFDAVQKVL